MPLDLPTLMVVLAVVQVVTAVIVCLLYYLHRTVPGPREWVIGKILHGGGLLVAFILGPGAGIWIVLAHLSQLVGLLFLLRGYAAFAGRRLPWKLLALMPLFYLTVVTLFQGDPREMTFRSLAYLSVLTTSCVLCGWVLLWRMPRHNVAQGFAGTLWAVISVFSMVTISQLVQDMSSPIDIVWSEGAPEAMGALIGWASIHSILMAGSMIMMVADRLRNQLNARIVDLEASRRVAEDALREQRNFLAMVSHEFRSPLSMIVASANVIGMHLPSRDRESLDEVDRIERVAGRLSNLVEACLADDWLDTAASKPNMEPTFLRDVLQAVTNEQKVRLTWEAGEDVLVDADGLLLPVVFSCLVDNANKYGRHRDRTEVVCRARSDGSDWVDITVLDDGPGLAAADFAVLSQKYRRAAENKGIGGSGLGLYLARRIVDLHGGEINVCEGAETGIHVALPVIPLEPERENPAEASVEWSGNRSAVPLIREA